MCPPKKWRLYIGIAPIPMTTNGFWPFGWLNQGHGQCNSSPKPSAQDEPLSDEGLKRIGKKGLMDCFSFDMEAVNPKKSQTTYQLWKKDCVKDNGRVAGNSDKG